jgi:hypothetical protein
LMFLHVFSTILYYSKVLCTGMVYMESLLFSAILQYCVQGRCTWILHYSLLFCSIVYRDGGPGFSTILYYSLVLCTGMVYMDSLLFCTVL